MTPSQEAREAAHEIWSRWIGVEDLAKELDAFAARVRAETIEQATKHLLDMAKAYKLGTPESRAIITATESMRVVLCALKGTQI